jgi:hypothetical protein
MRRWAIVVMIVIVLLFTAVIVVWQMDVFHTAERYEHDLSQLENQIKEVRNGKQDFIYLYGTKYTDQLLTHLDGLDHLRWLCLDMTDVSSIGISHLRHDSKLRALVIYVGIHFDDKALQALWEQVELEKLSLINTEITDKGIEGLRHFPNLRELTLWDSRSHGTPPFTESGLKEIGSIISLRRVSIAVSVNWDMNRVVNYLKKERPDLEYDGEEMAQKLPSMKE